LERRSAGTAPELPENPIAKIAAAQAEALRKSENPAIKKRPGQRMAKPQIQVRKQIQM
jgi:hypothetical protein